ncbi:hypothetical protein K7432_013907 [Basidiobolus ranarum]|uniref:Uncharacterized protein n=1 Tax=Basidiobolus ranarum TaxID=34480 RepID=A0ABR2WIG7_9FUNG
MIRRIQTAKHELDILDRVIGKGKAKAPPEHEDPYLLIEREIAEIASSIREVSLKIDDLRSIEANSALCLELALNDSELLPDITTYPASLEESNQGTCEIELNELNQLVSCEDVEDNSGENEKKRYLTEELNSSNSAGKKTKI